MSGRQIEDALEGRGIDERATSESACQLGREKRSVLLVESGPRGRSCTS